MESQWKRDMKPQDKSVFSSNQSFVVSVTGWPAANVHLPWEMAPQKKLHSDGCSMSLCGFTQGRKDVLPVR